MNTVHCHWVLRGLALAALAALPVRAQDAPPAGPDPAVKEFERLAEKTQKGSASEADAKRLLELGRDIGRPNAAFQAVRAYLGRNLGAAPEVLFLAAENAQLAGQSQVALSRYKGYLQTAGPGAASSEAAARLYALMLDFKNDPDDAYQFMRLHGGKFREGAARKFDNWFLEEATRRRDFAACAERLALVCGEKLPLEQERWQYWSELDRLLGELTRCGKEQTDAAPHLLTLAGLIRENPLRAARARFLGQHLLFKSSLNGKPETAQAELFPPVAAAALAYLQAAPTAETMEDIVCTLAGGGGGFSGGEWRVAEALKRECFVQALTKLPEAEQKKLAQWRVEGRSPLAGCATTEQWAEVAAKCPALFQSEEFVRDFDLPDQPKSAESCKKLAAVLKGVPTRTAARLNSLAAGPDFAACAAHLATQEAWHLDFSDLYRMLTRELWPAWNSFRPQEKPAADAFDKFLVAFGAEHIAKSPVALFDNDAVRDYLLASWRQLPDAPGEKAKLVPQLEALLWVPIADRKDYDLSGFINEFRNWAAQFRRSPKSKEKAVSEADQAALDRLETAVRNLQDAKAWDPDKAPGPVCRKLSQMVQAGRNRNQGELNRLCREFYPVIRDYQAKKTPWGEATVNFLARGRESAEHLDIQVDVLTDQLALTPPADIARRLTELLDSMSQAGKSFWRDMSRIQAGDRDKAKRLNDAFGQAVTKLAEQGRFSPALFYWFRVTRRGERWGDENTGNEVFLKLLEKRTLLHAGWTPDGRIRSGTGAYMWLVSQEFRGLEAKYPPASAFDDLFVEEARATGYLDPYYWTNGVDLKSKVAGVAAELLSKRDSLPFGYDGQKPLCLNRDEYLRWLDRLTASAPEVRNPFIARSEAAFGKTRFDGVAMGRTYFGSQANLETPEKRKEFFSRLAQYLPRANASLQREAPPYLAGLKPLEDSKATLTREEADALRAVFTCTVPAHWEGGYGSERAARLVYRALVSQKREAELFALIPHLWRLARDTRDSELRDQLGATARDHFDKKLNELALAHALAGAEAFGATLPPELTALFTSIRTQALGSAVLTVNVSRTDPKYPLYAGQAAFAAGNVDGALSLVQPHVERLVDSVKEFDPEFVLWLADRQIDSMNYENAEKLVRAMRTWLETRGAASDPELRGRIELSAADIAFGRRAFPLARASYEKLAVAREFDGTRAALEAEIRIAEVDRQTKQYDQAVSRLERLARRKERFLQAEAPYHIALVKYDQEEYPEAQKFLDQVFTVDANHAESRILEGQVLLKLKKLEQATVVKLGVSASQRVIVPGKPLRVSLEDRNLAIVGKSSNIEIRVWTGSGDEELFLLLPFGDSKTRFQGQIATAMAPPAKNDGTLQVLGKDTIHYDFSPAFRKAHSLNTEAPTTLTVVTDSELYASSGKILTRKEAEEQALERMLAEKLALDEKRQADGGQALSTLRPQDQIKPGNAIQVRVVDPDRNITPQPDRVTVRVAATSGDEIRAFPLVETGPYTGVFEGSVPTTSAEATAFASDSAEGSQPNFAISPGNYPAWQGAPDNLRPKLFSVDLKDNVTLGKLNLTADERGRKIKGFTVQTSLNGREFFSVGRWPEAFTPWAGDLEVEMVRYDGKKSLATLTAEDLRDYLEGPYLASKAPREALKLAALAVNWDKELAPAANKMQMENDAPLIVHLRGAFAVPRRHMLTFQLNPKGRGKSAADVLTVNGLSDLKDKTVLTRVFQKGVYRLDAYLVTTRSAAPAFEILSDIVQPPNLAVCPYDIFDPAKHPELKTETARSPATVTPNAQQSGFEVAFGAETHARMVRFVLHEFETDAPAINRLGLTDAAGKVLLPTQQDLLASRKDMVLMVVPGDRITITYEDPDVLTPNQAVHQVSLTATFTNATLSACFVEYGTPDAQGNRPAHYAAMRRFNPGERINVFIHDPDCDVSEQPDKVTFKAKATNGQAVEIEAVETAPHSGVFIGAVFPVTGEPQRKSEIKVAPGDEVILSYYDRENTDPGIPWWRTFSIEQAYYQDPELRVYDVAAQALTETTKGAPPKGAKPPRGAKPPSGKAERATTRTGEEAVPATRTMVATRPEDAKNEKPAKLLMEGPLLVEVLWPTIALSPESKTELFVQTSAGRKKYAKPLEVPFDIKVPGTLRLVTTPSAAARLVPPPGFREVLVRTDERATTALDDGRFTFSVPLELASLPEESLATAPPTAAKGEEPPGLAIRGDDEIFCGFKYTDAKGQTQWLTGRATLTSEAQFDVMDRRYEHPVEDAYVGETLYCRVIHRAMDKSDEKDRVTADVAAESGAKKSVELVETFEHSGIFKGFLKLAHAQEPEGKAGGAALGVQFGDKITLTYTAGGNLSRQVGIFKGSDGVVVPLTKQFADAAMAVQTQFTIAEAYFELAKKHRVLKEESLARREIGQGKKLLQEALRDNPDAALRAHGEFLLANLAFEFAQLAENEDLRKQGYQEALSRFNDLIGNYPDGPYAPKSQFKKALCLEKMGLMDQACEEYVKISYRYPDNYELIGDTVARLGQYFMLKGKELTDKSKAKEDEAKAEADAGKAKALRIEAEKIALRTRDCYRTAGQVLSRMERFITHTQSGRCLVLSGQCFIYALEYDKAIDVLKKAAEDPNAGKELASEALYWCGHAYMEREDLPNAYRAFKKVTWDYPETKYSRHAMSRLADPKLEKIRE